MRNRALFYILLALLLLTAQCTFGADARPAPARPVLADSTRPAITYRLKATKARDAPTIDGRLTEPVWQRAAVATGFKKFRPNPGTPASQPTQVRVAFDHSAVYVAARMIDDPDSVVAQTARRDQFGYSDRFIVFLDSYNDDRTAFGFGVTPAGSRLDAFYSGGTNEDQDWDAVWQAEARIDSLGWVAEFRIPLSQLQFDPVPEDETATWGLNFLRDIARHKERATWSPLDPNASRLVSRFGALHGLRGLSSSANLEVKPHVVGRMSRADAEPENPFTQPTGLDGTIGADLDYDVTPNLSVQATMNPTFGQVEADPSKVNLSAFETFFPEKRPFFVEGADLFSVEGPRLFYSRRIGRSPQGALPDSAVHANVPDRTTILGAAKMTGRTSGGWEIGALEAVTAPEYASYAGRSGDRGSAMVEPTTSYGVARVRKNLRGGKSTVGGIFTATNRPRLPSRLHTMHRGAYTGGFDGRHRFAESTYEIRGAVYGSQVRGPRAALQATQRSPTHYFQRPDAAHLAFDSTRTSLTGWSARTAVKKIDGTWQWNAALSATSPGFEINDLGYLRRADAVTGRVGAAYVNADPDLNLRRLQSWIRHEAAWTFGGERTETRFTYGTFTTFANYHQLSVVGKTTLPHLSTTALRGGPALRTNGTTEAGVRYETDSRKSVQIDLGVRAETDLGSDGYRLDIQSEVRYRPTSRASISLESAFRTGLDPTQYVATASAGGAPAYVFGEIRRRTLSMTAEASYAFTPEMTLEVYAQPFTAAGDYRQFATVAAPRADDIDTRYTSLSDRLEKRDGGYQVQGPGSFAFPDPDFNVREMRSTVVFRWQYRPGSTLYFVWNHDQSHARRDARFAPLRDVTSLFGGGSNTFGLKLTYWLGL